MKTDLVIGAFLIRRNKALLIHHKKLGLWLPVGGHIEKSETPDHALKREFKEELGIGVEVLNRNAVPKGGNIVEQLSVPFYVNVHKVGNHNHCCFFYVCKPKGKGKIRINKSELKDFGWFSPKELKQKHVPSDVRNIAMKAFYLFNKLQNK